MIEAIQLSKRYGNTKALMGLDLKVEPGEVFCLLGQNGAGKTTTINLFLGFTEPDGGKAVIDGLEVKMHKAAICKKVAYIPEVVQLYPTLTGMENLAFFSKLAGYSYDKPMLQNLLSQAGLPAEAHGRPLGTYSKGMRQKTGIAIALAKNASVIFMDEPTSGLDPRATAEFTQMCTMLAAQGKALFIATHDIFNAVQVATRIGIMKAGQLIHTLSANQIDASGLQQLYLETI
jgi:ABC-2 type transport system ATP-binding protein